MNETANSMNMIKVTPPLYGAVKCEGSSELYEMVHFGKSVYLTQSSQMYLEAVVPTILKSTYCDTPSFRKEKSRTKRHLTQFTHWEYEMFGFYDFDKFFNFLKEFIAIFFTKLFELDKYKVLEELNRIKFIENIISKPIKTLRHDEAITILNETGIKKENGQLFNSHDDIPESQERKLIDSIETIVFLTHSRQ